MSVMLFSDKNFLVVAFIVKDLTSSEKSSNL